MINGWKKMDIGTIDGALIGAKFGPWGALAGGVVGLGIWGIQAINPDAVKNTKEWAYNTVDKAKEWGKGIKQSFDSFGESVSKTAKNAGKALLQSIVPKEVGNFFNKVKETVDNTKIPQPSLNWFG